ncbi:MAG: hypothetical protein D3906_14745 [Candidatus Electrothrix sp. AUS1_2]|nr:hypothetical protein [Candidatus Electrothrix sp. AUS1_2]
MAKLGRNEKCPCGSGKKYKKCCLPDYGRNDIDPDEELLLTLTNAVPDFIEKGDLAAAERICNVLLKEYPDQIEGLQRSAEVCAAQGKLATAIEYYDKAIEFMKTYPEGFDSESIAWHQEQKEKMLAAQARTTA